MYSDRTLINRRNVTSDPHSNYRADRDFFLLIVKSRVIAAAMVVLGLEKMSKKATNFIIPDDITTLSKLQKLEVLHEAAGRIVDTFVFSGKDLTGVINSVLLEHEREQIRNNQELTAGGRFPCRFQGCTASFKYDGKSRRKHEASHVPPPVIESLVTQVSSEKPKVKYTVKDKPDDMYNYNSFIISDGLFFLNFLDSIAEGDGLRLMRQYKLLLLYCKSDGEHSTKYSLECLYQFFLIYALLSPRDAERFIWNRTVNNSGGKGKNIPLDLDTEHSNNFLKRAIKNLGPNLTERSVNRICHSEKGVRGLFHTVDTSIQQHLDSGKHSSPSLDRDLSELIKRLDTNQAMQEQPDGRSYDIFNNFQRNPFHNLDASNLYKWINGHKKNVDTGIKAR